MQFACYHILILYHFIIVNFNELMYNGTLL